MTRAFREVISNIASLELQESNGNIDEGEEEPKCIISRRSEPWLMVNVGKGKNKITNMKTGRQRERGRRNRSSWINKGQERQEEEAWLMTF